MYELAKKSREAMKSKARSLASSKDHKVDSSNWSPAEPLNADVKTGQRPVSKREFKAGGSAAAPRADRKARKSGGRVALKRGGKAGGGPLPAPEEAMRSEERMKTIRAQKQAPQTFTKDQKQSYEREEGYSAADRAARKDGGKKWIQSAIKKPGALHKQLGVPQGDKIPAKKLAAAADKGGKLGQRARLAETLKGLGRKGKDLGGVASALSPAYAAIRALQRNGKDEEHDAAEQAKGMAMANASRKKGGRVGRKAGGAAPNLTVIVADKGQHPGMPQAPGRGGVMPVMTPPAAPPAQLPPQAAPGAVPPPAAPPPAGMPPLARKSGGRIAKKASSYKDMEVSAGSGEGRLQKTDIASKHKNAPARKSGGRAVA